MSINNGKIFPTYGGESNSSASTSSKTSAHTQKETNNDTQAKINEYVEGTLSVLPNSDYTPRKIYKLNGVGKIFYGMYYTKSVTHTISGGAYSVDCEVMMVQRLVLNQKSKENVKLKVKAQDNPKFEVITIQRGDTLWDLAKKYDCTVNYLAKLNNIKNPDLIYTGNKLKVPSN